MANANIPQGIRPVKNNGQPFTGQGRMVAFPASQGSNIFLGDPIVPLGGSDNFGVPFFGLASAGAGNPIGGGFLGVSNGPAGSGVTMTRDLPVYRQGGILNYGFVSDDPNQLFVVQEDSVGGAIAAAVGAWSNGNLVAGVGNTVTGLSGWQLQSSSVLGAGNPTFQVRIVEMAREPDNALGNFANWYVRINLAALWQAAGI